MTATEHNEALASPAVTRSPGALPWHAAAMLAWREILRFFRQGSRVVGAIGQPVIIWLFFSAGFARSFRLGGPEGTATATSASFAEYYFPGTLVLILLFTAIFATISVIEDRREGFLQSVLVAPLPRWSMVLGKISGGAMLAMMQGTVFLLLALFLDVQFTVFKLLALGGLMLLTSLSLTALGFLIAWRMESTQGFHAIMTVFLMPLWLLSGAFFPVPLVTTTSSWAQIALHWVMRVNPLTYSVAGIHRLLFDGPLAAALFMPGLSTCWLVTAVFCLVMFVAAARSAGVLTRGDLQ
jgi:ABC-2 type transport system permease protein